MSVAVFLGPQRLQPTLRDALAALPDAHRPALWTGGWEERENEDHEIREHLTGAGPNLNLHSRLDTLLNHDDGLLEHMYAWRDARARQRRLSQIRLSHAMEACRTLLGRDDDDDVLRAEQDAAINDVRTIDAQHMQRMSDVRQRFLDASNIDDHPRVIEQRHEIRALLDDSGSLAVAGGHIGAMLEQAEVFDLHDALSTMPLISWSAGAMLLTGRIVLFHDSPPQGAGNAEVLAAGVGRLPETVLLPHARHRLRMDDPVRISLLARRFAPARCVALNEGDAVALDADGNVRIGHGSLLHIDGNVTTITEGHAP